MRYARIMYKGNPEWVMIDDNSTHILDAPPYYGGLPIKSEIDLEKCVWLAPCKPGKIVAVGKNYKDHIKELKNDTLMPDTPILFIKPSGTVIGPNQNIILPPENTSKRVDYEAELAFVVSHKAKNISVEDARKFILGYTCLNDVTARDIQETDGQWTRAKCFDTFAPIGPWITDEINPNDVEIISRLNGEIKQQARTSIQIWNVYELLSFISHMMTLDAGDVVTTGTPAGIGQLKAGDQISIQIEGIGELNNSVMTQ